MTAPMVLDGAMYGVAFLGLWGIALLLGSWQALVVAAFQHAYIWVHMYTVEAPDMRLLFGDILVKVTTGEKGSQADPAT